jgi:hypothetical protein
MPTVLTIDLIVRCFNMVIFCSIENPNRDFLFHSAKYTPLPWDTWFPRRINLFRYITQRVKRDGPMSGTEAFPVISPRYGLSHECLLAVAPAQRNTGKRPLSTPY